MRKFVRCNICGSNDYDVFYKPTIASDYDSICKYKIAEHKNNLILDIVRCKRCRLVYVNPQPKESDVLSSYINMKDNLYVKQEKGRRLSAKRILNKIERFKKVGNILDIGCSAGFLLDEARKREWKVYGIEPSEWASDYAKNNLKLNNIYNIKSFKDFSRPAFFDVIVIKDTLEHVIDPAQLLCDARQILKPDGILYISTPDISSMAAMILRARWWGIKNHHLYYFAPKTIKSLLNKCGFNVAKISRQIRFFQIGYILNASAISKTSFYKFLKKYLQKLPLKRFILPIDLKDQVEVFAKKQRKLCYIDELELDNSRAICKESKVIVVLPAYNASKTLKRTLADIPKDCVDDIILVDDKSTDNTLKIAESLGIRTFSHETNRGYGGNQKTCYKKALELDADIIVMVHPDYQYDPKMISELIKPIKSQKADAVFGSRMMKGGALEGGMPLWKHNANILLTAFENVCFGTYLTEYHSGFRAYSSKLLNSINFEKNSDGFIFDTEIIAQTLLKGFKIKEIPIRTRYFDEASKINLRDSLWYGFGIINTIIKYIIHIKTPFNFKQFM